MCFEKERPVFATGKLYCIYDNKGVQKYLFDIRKQLTGFCHLSENTTGKEGIFKVYVDV
jgi:hypothetical protein